MVNNLTGEQKDVFIGFAYKDVIYYFSIIHSAHRQGIINYYNVDALKTVITPITENIINIYESMSKNRSGYSKEQFKQLVLKEIQRLTTKDSNHIDLFKIIFLSESFLNNPQSVIAIWKSLMSFHEAIQFVSTYNKETKIVQARSYVQTLYDYAKSGTIFSSNKAAFDSINYNQGDRKGYIVSANKSSLLTSSNLPFLYKQVSSNIGPVIYKIESQAENTLIKTIEQLQDYIYIAAAHEITARQNQENMKNDQE